MKSVLRNDFRRGRWVATPLRDAITAALGIIVLVGAVAGIANREPTPQKAVTVAALPLPGTRGHPPPGLVGAVLGALFAVSGSIWLPIVAHILIDVTQGRQLREIYRDVAEPASAP